MGTIWRDVSRSMYPGMTIWPGDPAFFLEPDARIATGDGCNTSRIALSTHTGTHCDAPWHFEDDGKRLHEVDPQLFFGDALLIDLPQVDRIRASDLPRAPLPARVLFKTRHSGQPEDVPFQPDFVAVDADAARRLADDGVRLVGVDYLSVAPYKQPGRDTHHILLSAGVLVVEGLRLGGFPAGTYPFVVLPLPILDADGAPCRAFLGTPPPSAPPHLESEHAF